uniref:Fat storage-inducing transmembrane protein 1 homolog n=1 Tax=Oryzias latipes TaxID=8090 RepID=A0A3P9IQG6_ORYLA
MDPKTGNSWKGLVSELERFHMIATELKVSGRFFLRPLDAALQVLTNLLARILGSNLVRRHFHLVLSGLVLFGPLLSFWVSKHNIFANSNHFLYRKFLRSTWGWTCILTGSFVLLLSFSACRSVPLSLRHFSRIGLAGLLWWGTRRLLTLLEDAAGCCYEPMPPAQDVQSPAAAAQPPLLLHEDQTKASCLRANLLWRGYEVSQDVLILCLCCLLLLEEISVFGRHLSHEKRQQRSPGAPIRILFLLCVVLLIMWMFLLLCLLANFPNWPSQQLGGALGYLGWRGLYQGWYRLNPRWCCPGLPGEELFITSGSVKEPKRL